VGNTPLEVVRSFTGSLGRGEIDACKELVHPELVFSEAESLPFGGDWIGAQGFVAFLSAISAHYRVRVGEMVVSEAGDRVVARVSGTIQSRVSGRTMPLDAIDVYEVRDGLIVRVDVYYKDAAAVTELLDPAEAGVPS
jgi:ketosteroid isomerase-like protein